MQFTAVHRFARIGPRKARLVVDMIRGLAANQAIEELKLINKRAAVIVRKVVESAVANAGLDADVDSLWVCEARVDGGPTLKRWRPRARGRMFPIRKPTSHITIVLSD